MSDETKPVDAARLLELVGELASPTQVVLSRVGPDGWLCGIEFGREAPDSPMAGSAAYGSGETPQWALQGALMKTGLLPQAG